MMSDQPAQEVGHNQAEDGSQFICGVIEGFYGRPWSNLQRKDLFKRLRELNLNTFMYAPKDDAKHRAKWRLPYDADESRELKSLIDEATNNGIDFYYSLAPGLDMVYSNEEDVAAICKKFDQIRELGCRSFALLFDDIDPCVTNEKDKAIYQDNYAAAQVFVTNHIYDYLKQPKFLFCPTEYCESRAVPSVADSLYLNTIGKCLKQGIDFMWSGSRVISRFITEESIQTLTDVIRRRPVIWENLHANDYDKRRVFLGPYSGRSTKIIPKLKGVLTNPNCEYEANYVAIHTLAQWSRCTRDINTLNRCNRNSRTTQLTDLGEQNDSTYDPDRALVYAVRDWLPHLLSKRDPLVDQAFETEMQRDDISASNQLIKNHPEPPSSFDENPKDAEIIDHNVDMPDDSNSTKCSKSEMDTNSSPINSIGSNDANSRNSCEMQDVAELIQNETGASEDMKQMPVADCASCNASFVEKGALESSFLEPKRDSTRLDDLILLADFFYLPFEHGSSGYAFLSEIRWLIDNSGILISNNNSSIELDKVQMSDDEKVERMREQASGDNVILCADQANMIKSWEDRSEKLRALCNGIAQMIENLIRDCPNKLFTAELYPYLIDLRNSVGMVMDYTKFLKHRKSTSDNFFPSSPNENRNREPASLDEQEPWVHRGGLIGDLQRLIS